MKPHLLVSVIVIAACSLAVPLHAAEEVLRSPDGTIVVSVSDADGLTFRAACDETIVPSAEEARHLVVARRKDQRWYLAAMNGDEALTLKVPLAFLPEGKWAIHRFADTVQSATSPERIEETRSALSNRETITLKLAPAGDFVAILEPSSE